MHKETPANARAEEVEGVATIARQNLKATRKAKDMTQKQVSEYLCVGERHYKKIESGETLGSVEIWDKLEDLFNVSQRILRKNCHSPEDSR